MIFLLQKPLIPTLHTLPVQKLHCSAEANSIYLYNKTKPGDSSALQYMNGRDTLPNIVY